jgi:5-methylcytosine-specific restriction protein A
MCPRKPRKPCRFQGCAELTEERYCDKHKKQVDSEYNRTSRPFKHLYNTSRWKKLRKQFLQEHPLCVECEAKDVIKAATVVDHMEVHKGDEDLFWDESNWQALCKQCHDRKTAKKDGRWGNKNKIYTY